MHLEDEVQVIHEDLDEELLEQEETDEVVHDENHELSLNLIRRSSTSDE
jgi:hypothetical protein